MGVLMQIGIGDGVTTQFPLGNNADLDHLGNPLFYRTDWQGTQLLYPTARTNLAIDSQVASNWGMNFVTNVGGDINAAVAPDGTLTADFVREDASTNIHYVNIDSAGQNITAGSATVFKIFAKDGGAGGLAIRVFGSPGFTRAFFAEVNLVTGAVTGVSATGGATATSCSAVSRGGGWWEINLVGTIGGAETHIVAQALFESSNNTAGSTAKGHYLWGVDLKQAATPTSYIPTTTTAVTVTDYTLSNGIVTLPSPLAGRANGLEAAILYGDYSTLDRN